MTPEQAARLTDIVARVVRGEPGSGAELADEVAKALVWREVANWNEGIVGGASPMLVLANSVREAHARLVQRYDWTKTGRPMPIDRVHVDGAARHDLAGLTLDEAKARVTAEFEARGYVVLP